MKRDYCRFFADIEANPTAIIDDLTIQEFLEARDHLYSCDACFNRSERVLKNNPKNQIGFNNPN